MGEQTEGPKDEEKAPLWLLFLIALYLVATLVLAGLTLLQVWPPLTDADGPAETASSVTLLWSVSFSVSAEIRVILLVFAAGAIGSCAYGLWAEFVHIARRDFQMKWTLWYAARPFIGAFFALIFYLLFRAGLLSAGLPTSQLNVFGFTAVAALVGMFSEQSLALFKEIAETVLTTANFRTEELVSGQVVRTDGRYVFVGHPDGVDCQATHKEAIEVLHTGERFPLPECGNYGVWLRVSPILSGGPSAGG